MTGQPVKCVRARIMGQVQGVWYRGWTVDQARALGLSGWVRNRRDGSVEAVFCGPVDAVDAMIARCSEGPPAARVEAVETSPDAPPGRGGFEQAPTV